MAFSKDNLQRVARNGALLAVALCCLCTAAMAADEKADIKAITAVYEAHSKAFRNKDIKGLFAGMTPDCKIIDKGAPISIPQLKSAFTQKASQIKSITEYREDISNLHIHGKKATASIHVTFTGKIADGYGGIHDMFQTGGSEDTLIKTSSGAWKLQRSEIQFFHVVMDGKRVNSL